MASPSLGKGWLGKIENRSLGGRVSRRSMEFRGVCVLNGGGNIWCWF